MPKQSKDMKSQDRERVVKALKALSNENRMAIFEQIRAGHGRGRLDADNRLSVCTVAENLIFRFPPYPTILKNLGQPGWFVVKGGGNPYFELPMKRPSGWWSDI